MDRLLRTIIFLLSISFCFTGQSFAYSDSEAKQACETYKDAVKQYKRGKNLHKAESLFIEAMGIIGSDETLIRYSVYEDVLKAGSGRYPEYISVTVPYKCDYYPEEKLGNVRERIPPVPVVMAEVFMQDDVKMLSISVKNTGSTNLNDFSLDGEVLFQTVKPNEVAVVELDYFDGKSSGVVSLIFKERFGFVPPPVEIKF